MSTGKITVLQGSASADIAEIMGDLDVDLTNFAYDQYRYYPATDRSAWEGYFLTRLQQLLKNDEWTFYCDEGRATRHMVGCRVSDWDYEHFGIRMANVAIMLSGDDEDADAIVAGLLDRCLEDLRGKDIDFVSTRVCGSNIRAIHALEERGFLYYENAIWPVVRCEDMEAGENTCVRLMRESDLAAALEIARANTYQSSHFHCDKRFDAGKVDSMHAKWLESAWNGNRSISVIEWEGAIAGYFVFQMDSVLSDAMGYTYGRMQNMALDKGFRGQGLGTRLFAGTIALMRGMGAEYIDSGYSSKNHLSAKLHVKYSFFSVYEEVSFHHWLK